MSARWNIKSDDAYRLAAATADDTASLMRYFYLTAATFYRMTAWPPS